MTSESTLLRNDSSNIMANIDEFINSNQLNIDTDIDTIIKRLSSKLIIRAKLGGVCIKSSIRDCSKDAKTNEMYCAYEVYPNLFHIYYMVSVSYEQFQDTKKIYEYNKNAGFLRPSEKELHKLKYIIKKKLFPELNDLKKQLQLKGVDAVLSKYPDLLDIITNYDTIFNEVQLWIRN